VAVSREVRLSSRPVGMPTPETFDCAQVEVLAPADGEVQVRNLWMAVDPAMRGRMSDAKSYVPPFEIGKPLEGPAVGEVIASRSPEFAPGDLVFSRLGWRELFNAPGAALQKRDRERLPPQAYLGFAGSTGLTAYVGLFRIAALQGGETVFVSAASGGVGSVACQIAKLKGCKVIGSAGGARKAAFLRDELGLDAVIDYKAEPNLTKALAAAAPDGLDVYFDNVGGDHLQAALAVAKPFARFALCGMISAYNATEPVAAPRNLVQAVIKRLRLEGFIVLDHFDLESRFLEEVTAWHRQGLLKQAETVFEGVDRAPEAFLGLFRGENLGRMLVRLEDGAAA
jgi:NADPH-dependent curcumin reductase CurA